MDAIKKSHEIQMQVRHNAEEYRNTLNDLYNWEKEMKEKEQELIRRQEDKRNDRTAALPIRSHEQMDEGQANHKQTLIRSNQSDIADEAEKLIVKKQETEQDSNEDKRTKSNSFKELGNKYVKVGQYDNAIQEYSRAIDIFSKDSVYYTNRALCYLKLERYNECIEDCERAIEIDSKAVKAYYRRMQANEHMGNHMDALKDCTTVLMIEPKNSEANKSLMRINERLRIDAKCTKGSNFTMLRDNMIDILPIDKPPYKRSSKPLQQISISDVIGPKETKNTENTSLRISDEDIDKLFNSNCGPFIEVKNGNDSTRFKKEDGLTQEIVINRATASAPYVQKKVNKNSSISLPVAINTNATNTITLDKYGIAPDLNLRVHVNNVCSESSENYGVPATESELRSEIENRPLPPSPMSTAQFYSNWKELSSPQRYKYMKSIDLGRICKILGAGFDSDTLTDILYILRDFYLPNKDETVAATLLEVSKNNQVTILSLLMSSEERKIIIDILNTIKENKSNTSTVELITKNFNLH